jgi:hypothetical protein
MTTVNQNVAKAMQAIEKTKSKPFGCNGNTIKLLSGRYLDLADPRPDQFTFSDIAGALAKICRFGGQCPYFYSVAEHSYWCCRVAMMKDLPPEGVQAALLHDAAEAFIGDVVKPLKIMLPDYDAIERRMELAIEGKFGLNFCHWISSVGEIDKSMLIAERNQLFGADGVKWTDEDQVKPVSVKIERWTWARAMLEFTSLAKSIGINIIQDSQGHIAS